MSNIRTKAWYSLKKNLPPRAVIILSGFTLFAVAMAMVIQQMISWGTVSS